MSVVATAMNRQHRVSVVAMEVITDRYSCKGGPALPDVKMPDSLRCRSWKPEAHLSTQLGTFLSGEGEHLGHHLGKVTFQTAMGCKNKVGGLPGKNVVALMDCVMYESREVSTKR